MIEWSVLWPAAIVANYLVAILMVGSILRRQKEPTSMLAWIFTIITVPVFGWVLYLLFGSTRIRRRARRRRRHVAHVVSRGKRRAEHRTESERDAMHLPEDLATVERITRRMLGVPATEGNLVQVYQEPNATYYALEEAIRAATDHIHLEYYIWQPDDTGRHFRDLLAERAREGIRVRLLLDAVGSWRTSWSFLQPLLDAGAQVSFFQRVSPLRRRWNMNLRNHRKIVVVDGQEAFLGSQNIGDEYLGRLKKLSPWRDAHMRLAGPAVLFVQQVFIEDWYFATRENIVGDRYFPRPLRYGESIVQTVATGPDEEVGALDQIVFAAVSTARESIRIATPYFVPGAELRAALRYAAYRGVKVKLVLPTRHDAPVVLWAGRSFYGELLAAGVEIHEYDDGVLHSKLITIDHKWCMLGSANMDVRSFRLNFEITALVYDPRVTAELSFAIDRDIERSRRISQEDVWKRSVRQQLIEGGARVLAPLL